MRLTYTQARYREGHAICAWCHVEVDAKSREYRATGLCQFCYDEQTIVLEHKELLHDHTHA
jgi:hypothetical protein